MLSDKTRQKAGLVMPELLHVSDVEYLEYISDRCSYLYDIVGRICGIDDSRIKLYVQDDGAQRPEEADGWNAVQRDRTITHGNYLCVVSERGCPILHCPILG